MNVTVNIDCSPEEARRFIGLPDLSPLHAAYLDRAKVAIEQGLTPDSVRAMMQTWGPMGEAGMTLWKQMLDQLGAKN